MPSESCTAGSQHTTTGLGLLPGHATAVLAAVCWRRPWGQPAAARANSVCVVVQRHSAHCTYRACARILFACTSSTTATTAHNKHACLPDSVRQRPQTHTHTPTHTVDCTKWCKSPKEGRSSSSSCWPLWQNATGNQVRRKQHPRATAGRLNITLQGCVELPTYRLLALLAPQHAHPIGPARWLRVLGIWVYSNACCMMCLLHVCVRVCHMQQGSLQALRKDVGRCFMQR